MNVEIYHQLKEFGIERTLAEEAAKRYGSMEAAVDWCFGPGANWKTDEPLPSYGFLQAGEQTEHREVAGPSLTPPSLPPRNHAPASTAFSNLASPPSTSFASNNPFAANPPPPDQTSLDDHDEDLQRALHMSQQQLSGSVTPEDETEAEIRNRRERSVRATAPPPSPSPKDLPALDTLFGPSEKTEDGSTALVALPSQNKEEEDLNRAIQDSLMTASFHSASAMQVMDKAEAVERQTGAPLVLLSQSGEMTYAALFLQAMMAVPQMREVLKQTPIASSTLDSARRVQTSLKSLDSQFEAERESFIEVDDILKELTYRTSQLPPERGTRGTESANELIPDLLEKFDYQMIRNWLEAVRDDPDSADPRPRGGHWEDPDMLFKSVIHQPHNIASYVTFRRSARLPNNLYAHLSDILWARDALPSSIKRLAEILAVFIAWDSNVKREIWKLEEKVVLDRFMKDEEMWATQIRAEQSVAGGNARRLKEQIERLTFHNGSNYQESLAALIRHYESCPPNNDPVQAETQAEVKAKLVKIRKILQSKVEVLQTELDQETEKSSGELFHSTDPERNKHVYLLRAVLFHDGSLIGGRHLYGYFRGDDSRWWRVQEHEITQVDWTDVESDSTGIYMEGGPYQLIYSRDGPPPRSQTSTPTSEDTDTRKERNMATASEPDLISLDATPPEASPKRAESQPSADNAENLIVLD